LAVIEETSGATESQMAAMREEVQRVNTELPIGLRDATAAAKELSFAGQNTEEMLGSLAPTAQLAAASNLTVADSARLSASMLNQFGYEADKTAAITDSAAGVFANSAITLDELGQSAQYAGTQFAVAGQDIATLNTFIGVLGDAGIRGSKAGTALRRSVSRLTDPTEEAEERMSALGLSVSDFTDSEGNMRDMMEIFEMLGERLEGASEQERIAAMADIFGLRAAPAALELADAAAKGEAQTKRLAVQASQLGGAMDRLSELDNEALRERNQELQQIAQQEGMAATLQLEAGMDQMGALRQLRGLSEQLSEEELTTQIETALDVESGTAQQLAFEMESGTDLQALNEELERAQTTGGLTEAQMDTLGGRIEYIKGSLKGITFSMFEGVKPVLTPALEVLMGMTDALSENEWAARALGTGLALLTGTLATMTTLAGIAIARTYALRGAQLASEGATLASAGAQNVLSASYWRSAAASTAATAKSWLLTGARSAGRAAGYATAGAEWALTTARNSSTLAAVRARGAQMGLTASYYAGQTAAYASAAGAYALSGASTTLSGALGLAAGAASTLWAALGPLGLLALGITAIIAGDALGLPVLDGIIDSTIGKVTGLLGPLGGIEGIAATGAGALNWMAEGAGWLGSQIAGLLTPANAAKAALLAFPGLGLAAWLFDAAGGADALRGGVDALLHPAETAQRLLGSIPGVGLVDWTGAAELGFRALTDPIGLVQDGVQWLLNKVPELPDPEDVPLLSQALNLYDKGEGAVASLAEGMRANKDEAGAAAGDVAGETDKRMPSSPAEVGPLAALDQSGPSLVRTFAQGIRANTGEAGSAASALASAAVGALPEALPSPSVAPIDAPAVAQPAAPGVSTPQAPAASVDARVDVRSLRAQVDEIAPLALPVKLVLAEGPDLSDTRDVLADVSPLSGVVSQAVRARSELEAGARSLATRIGDLSLPGGETTIAEAAGVAIETVEDTVGVELPGLPLGAEQRQQAVEQRVADRRLETPTPPGGFETMTAAVRPTEAGSIEQRVTGRSDPAAPIGPRGPQGPIGPRGPAGDAGGATAAVGAGRVAQPPAAMIVEQPARPETIGTPSTPAPDAPPTPSLDPVVPKSNTGTSPVPAEDVDRQQTEQQQHTGRRPVEVNLEQHITFEEPPGGSGDGGPSIEEIRAMMNEAGDEILDEVSGWFTRYDDETGSNRGS
jgi:TP901 family phage tail tape measure protein